ncbi:hypothetical protein Q6247_27015, partial [Klebsiella pneumoniae]
FTSLPKAATPQLAADKMDVRILARLARKIPKPLPKKMPAEVRRTDVWRILARFGQEQNRPKYTRIWQKC